MGGARSLPVRGIVRLLRAPAKLDRPGLRWALRLCSPYPILVIEHRGRRSGRIYRTPLELLAGEMDERMLVLPLFGYHSDWYRNVVAGGLVAGSIRGRRGPLDWERADLDEARAALDGYRRKHPVYTRVLLGIIARLNGLPDVSTDHLAQRLPMVAMRFRLGATATRP